MLSYPEEKAVQFATASLLKIKMAVEAKYIGVMNWLERQGDISIEEHNKYCDAALAAYDRDLALAESEYDKAMDKIRAWKKNRRDVR